MSALADPLWKRVVMGVPLTLLPLLSAEPGRTRCATWWRRGKEERTWHRRLVF